MNDHDNGWNALLADLQLRQNAARAMGGPESLVRQRESGRLDARGRIDLLLDADSFREIGLHAGSVGHGMSPATPADALVAGHGSIDGRPLVVGAEDFTVMGGSIGVATKAKRHRLVQLAGQEQVPLVMLLEGAGERAQNSFEALPHAPNDFRALVGLRGHVPTVSVVMGVSAGQSALTAPLTDFTVMVQGGAMFAAGPPVVATVTGEEVSREQLGGATLHSTRSGVVQNVAEDDRHALDLVRRYLSYFPTNAALSIPTVENGPGERLLDEILDLIPADPRLTYDIGPVLEVLLDPESLLEIQPDFGRSLVTGLGRLGGASVAVVANNPALRSGVIDRDAAEKAARFLGVVGAFGLPVVFLADTPGLAVGTDAEASGILRAATLMFEAQARIRGPKLHVTLRKAHGFGAALMAMNPFDAQSTTLALPGARLGAMPAETGSDAAGVEPDVRALLEHAELGGAYGSADRMSYDDVIDPR
ncbi:MAG: carboxyl transferase domain-containing protein, partial [Acidimicrobiia bacterium]